MARRLVFPSFLALALTLGCFNMSSPGGSEGKGKIIITYFREASYAGGAHFPPGSPMEMIAVADSIVVKVFHAGSSTNPEAVRGVGISENQDSIEVSISVSPELNKRVSVELFEQEKLLYFGSNEDVDVFAGKVTKVSIDAFAFVPTGLRSGPAYTLEGDTLRLYWRGVTTADSYRFQKSRSFDFMHVDFDTVVSDTFLHMVLPGGKHFFRVAARNAYLRGPFCYPHLAYIYSSPLITSISPGEAVRGEYVILYGHSLDYPGNVVYLGDQECEVVSGNPEQLTIRLPLDCYTDYVEVDGPLGYAISPSVLRIQLIAYVCGGDTVAAFEYRDMIESYGVILKDSGVKIVPDSALAYTDMSVFGLILVGNDTGTHGSDWAGGVPERAQAIEASGAQVLGLGYGGAAYFDIIALKIGRSFADVDTAQDIYVMSKNDLIYNVPNQIYIPPDMFLSMYSADVTRISVQADPMDILQGLVNPHAKRNELSLYYPLVDQETSANGEPITNFLWGFDARPSSMKPVGRECFMNIVCILFYQSFGGVIPVY